MMKEGKIIEELSDRGGNEPTAMVMVRKVTLILNWSLDVYGIRRDENQMERAQ